MYLFGYCSEMNQNHAAWCHSSPQNHFFRLFANRCYSSVRKSLEFTRDFLDITRIFVLVSLEPQITCIRLHCRANEKLPCAKKARLPCAFSGHHLVFKKPKIEYLTVQNSRPDKKNHVKFLHKCHKSHKPWSIFRPAAFQMSGCSCFLHFHMSPRFWPTKKTFFRSKFTAHFFLIPITQNGIRMKTWWQNSGFMASYGIHIIKSYQIPI